MKKKQKKEFQGKKRKRRAGLSIIVICVLAICAVVIYKQIGLNEEYDVRVAEYENLLKEKQEEEERSVEIEKFKMYTETNKYIEDIAREVLGLVYEDEIIFVPEE